MPRVLIIADDLTGAADCGVMFRKRGMETAVLLGNPGQCTISASDLQSAEVVAIDIDTRCLSTDEAADKVSEMVRLCDGINSGGNRPLLFKKVDSTLRGNVAAELAAALGSRRALIPPPARVGILFAPAFPALGRTTVNGRQMVNGLPLEKTDLWQGKRARPHSEIAEMLGEAGLTCAKVDLGLIRGGMNAIENTTVSIANLVDVLVCDAETEEDLQAIARSGMMLDKGMIWAGSAGLARHLASVVGFAPATHSSPAQICGTQLQGPVLFVVGSQAAASREQADLLAAAEDLACYRVPPNSKPAGKRLREQAKQIAKSLANRHDVLVRLDPVETSANDQDRLIARSVAQMLAPCSVHVGALVATGGDTARAILDAWGIERLTLLGEVEPGLPYSIATCGDREIVVLTKAGGFGTRDTLLRCREFLGRRDRDLDTVESKPPVEDRKS